MERKIKKAVLLIYSLVHFIVDLSCAVLFSNLITTRLGNTEKLFAVIVIYNLFAFAFQLPIGIIADRLNKNALCSAAGCALVIIAYALSGFELAAAVIAGLGNALFHIGGGIDVLNISDGKAAPSGVFVSTGALGIFLGAKSASFAFDVKAAVLILLAVSLAALAVMYCKIRGRVCNAEFALPKLNSAGAVAVICLFVTVCIRSYVGMILAFEWKAQLPLAVLSIAAVILGKMLGGIIGDRVGYFKLSALSLGIAAVLFAFAFSSPACGIIATLLFNMTMPITLAALGDIFKNAKGLAFGLLTLALFIGAAPKFFGLTALFTPVGLCAVTLASAVILCIGIKEHDAFTEIKNDC